jgi:hypothetical protein
MAPRQRTDALDDCFNTTFMCRLQSETGGGRDLSPVVTVLRVPETGLNCHPKNGDQSVSPPAVEPLIRSSRRSFDLADAVGVAARMEEIGSFFGRWSNWAWNVYAKGPRKCSENSHELSGRVLLIAAASAALKGWGCLVANHHALFIPLLPPTKLQSRR